MYYVGNYMKDSLLVYLAHECGSFGKRLRLKTNILLCIMFDYNYKTLLVVCNFQYLGTCRSCDLSK